MARKILYTVLAAVFVLALVQYQVAERRHETDLLQQLRGVAQGEFSGQNRLENRQVQGQIEIVKADWQQLGRIAIWTVRLRNKSPETVGDILYSIHYYAETGAYLAHDSGTIHKFIPASKARTFKVNAGIVHPQAVRANFNILDWKKFPRK